MKIYEFLGIDHLLMDIPIPQDAILENMDVGSYFEAVSVFRNIDYISLRVSLNRDEHYLQVLEIGMNTPRDIDTIAKIIQKTIKYRILFIFTYQEHYLILWRNFKLTDSTEYVYTDAVTYCTDWIYDESLDMEVLWSCKITKINNEHSRIVPLSFKKKNKKDDDGMGFFRDVVRNVCRVSGAIINRELVSARYIVDWFSCHAIGERVDLNYLLCEAIREEIYMIVDDHLFFEKDRLEILCSEIENPNYKYKVNIGRTGRVPWIYFDSIAFPATYDDECDIISRLHEVVESDGQYLVQLLDDHVYDVPAKRESRYIAQRSLDTQGESARKSFAQQKREEEYLAAVEQELSQRFEEQRAEEEARRKAEEEARRKAEEEARRKAEEEARRKAEEEARRKAEEEARRKAEEEARRKAEEEARRKAEEKARRKAETTTVDLAKGIVVEACLENRGPVATVIVQKGTLNQGDIIVIGSVVGRVRTMSDSNNGYVKTAMPFAKVKISGLSNVPNIGDTFEIVSDTDAARKLAEANRNENNSKTKPKEKEEASTNPTEEMGQVDRAKKYIGIANNLTYFNWLSAKVSGNFLDEIIIAYERIQRFAVMNNLLNVPLLETTDMGRLRSIQDAIRVRKEFIKLGANSRYFCGLAMRHYVQYVSELEAKQFAVDAEARCKVEAEARRKAEAEVRRKAEEEARRKAEEEARRKAEEACRKIEEESRIAEERRKKEETLRHNERARLVAAFGIIEDVKRQEETRRKIEQLRLLVRVCRQIELAKQQEASRRVEEESRRRAEEERRIVEERRRAEEAKCQEVLRRKAEDERRLAEEHRKAEEARRQEALRRKAEEEARQKAEEERRWAVARRAQYRRNNRCQYCGGEFKAFLGLFGKKCKVCDKPKDY